MLRARVRALALVAVAVLLGLTISDSPAGAATFVPLSGDGSSWAEPAITQWARDVHPQGIQVSFNGDGSAQGRANFISGNVVDFAASDIAFLTSSDPFGGGVEQPQHAYSYIPIVAGGTTFMYNLVVGGHKITNLRLSGDTVTKIFTGQITNWSDKRITHDYGAQLPSQPITVVTRSDGSGATYQFTRWMSKVYTSQWNAFCRSHHGPGGACPPTEFYPGFTGSIQKNGSDQVASFIASSIGEGAIGYDEYAYALNDNVPVVKLLNPAGFYTLPTASNVAIALQSAVIDENQNSLTFLIQNLDHVYTSKDPRSYPLSSYSYLIVPRDSRPGFFPPTTDFTTAKGKTLSTWLNYVLCGAQQSAAHLGYSPLPVNLVTGGFLQDRHIPGAVPTPDLAKLSNCNNPTYHNGVNLLVKTAPFPNPCDKVGEPLNCTVSHGRAVAVGARGSSSGAAAGTAGSSGGPGGAAAAAAGGAAATTGAAAASVDPNTGQLLNATQGSSGPVQTQPESLPERPEGKWMLSSLTALTLIAAVATPTVLGALWQRRRKLRVRP
jgi:ABC-type phosphate transport system substrate-binding protein